MESLWVSFARDGIDIPSPEWHRNILEHRAARMASGEASALTVDALQTRLRQG
ncbi:MAG: addiction module protein [Verrucomicrobia bacterium]|nr:addiction module protein [Verrucomicrobiota bacterium]MDA1007175.1 addiction module protein [Verrucomicrobiota bacterium]